MAKNRKQTPPWRAFVWGLLVSVGLYLCLLVLLTFLTVRGVLGEEGTYPAIAAACGVSALSGGLVCVRDAPMGRLPAAMLCAGGFAAVLAVVGLLCWEEGVTVRGLALLGCTLAGGLAAGAAGGRRGRRVKSRARRR